MKYLKFVKINSKLQMKVVGWIPVELEYIY